MDTPIDGRLVAGGAPSGASISPADVPPPGVPIFVVLLSFLAAGVAGLAAAFHNFEGSDQYWVLIPFLGFVAAAAAMDVRFRIHGQVEAFNLLEAVLAPLVFAFAGPFAMLAVIGGQLLAGAIRLTEPVKIAFNAAQWALATGLASLVFAALNSGSGVTLRNLGALLAAMAVMGVVNQVCVTAVIALSQNRRPADVLTDLSAVIMPGWVAAWGLNTLVGFLFVFAYASSPFAVFLFFVPLAILHAAYRGYAGTESDRTRLAGLHRASQLLAAPVEPDHALADFLAEVSRCFEAHGAELVIVEDDRIVVHSVHEGDASTYAKSYDVAGCEGLRGQLLTCESTTRVENDDATDLGRALRAERWRNCLMSPLPSDNSIKGVLVIFDQDGLEGFEEGERAVLEALARETTSSFEKGRLFDTIVRERHKLSQLVETTFDGILSLDAFGIVRAWNSGWAQITGQSAQSAIGKPLRSSLKVFDLSGREVPLSRWIRLRHLPEEVRIGTSNGATRWMQCSYRKEVDSDGETALLTIVAHDVTDTRRVEKLQEDVGRLAELEALQRQRVLQLQESLQPGLPVATQAEFGVHYLPSDTNAPTGGDFYDWKVLPDGNVHIAVVDVLGHGVEATNDAFTVIHTLRTLAFQGTAVDKLIAAADAVLSAASPELVATVILLRYDPRTGKGALAGGGHPPALLIGAGGSVTEVSAPGIPIGWPGAGSEHAVDVQLGPSETLALYTDGLIEARRDILLGLEELARTASEVNTMAAPDMARALVERSLIGAERRDDSLALVLRHAGSDVSTIHPMHYRASPAAEQVPTIRHMFRAWASQHLADNESVDDLAMAISELTTNSMRVADRFVEIRATFVNGGLNVEVEDDGPGFDYLAQSKTPRFDDDESGRGLSIARMLVDDLDVDVTSSGCTIRIFKSVSRSLASIS